MWMNPKNGTWLTFQVWCTRSSGSRRRRARRTPRRRSRWTRRPDCPCSRARPAGRWTTAPALTTSTSSGPWLLRSPRVPRLKCKHRPVIYHLSSLTATLFYGLKGHMSQVWLYTIWPSRWVAAEERFSCVLLLSVIVTWVKVMYSPNCIDISFRQRTVLVFIMMELGAFCNSDTIPFCTIIYRCVNEEI